MDCHVPILHESLAGPLVKELCPAPSTVEVFRRLSTRPHCLFLDSAALNPGLGRYSFVTADPFSYSERYPKDRDSLGELRASLAKMPSSHAEGLPPFQGGAAGLFGYDLGRQLERLPAPRADEFQVPALAIGMYDVVVAWDHLESRAWIISQGWPELDSAQRRLRAARRLKQFQHWLAEPGEKVEPPAPSSNTLQRNQLIPQYPVSSHEGLVSNFSEEAYLRAVERVIRYITDGDVFQVNLAQRLLLSARSGPVALYLRLRECNPAPFAGYFDLGKFQVVSASPERFLKVRQRDVETRPIKGTRERSIDPSMDSRIIDELKRSEKDRAENVMIVDLLRNDLSKVCQADSVQVEQLCGLESYQYVHHLVSSVTGRLREGHGPIDLLRAAFPGGSITGAPKIRAMEIIAELEPAARGPYCGSLGYVGFDGNMDSSILIRTITAGSGWWQAPVGGGIVAQSDPAAEYEETIQKAGGMLRALSAEKA